MKYINRHGHLVQCLSWSSITTEWRKVFVRLSIDESPGKSPGETEMKNFTLEAATARNFQVKSVFSNFTRQGHFLFDELQTHQTYTNRTIPAVKM